MKYTVYRVSVSGYYYYGMTSNAYNRKRTHQKSIKDLMKLKSGLFKIPISETGYLKFHHKAASGMLRSKWTKNCQNFCIGFSVVFETDVKELALEVEYFLVSKSLKDKKCCNVRCDYKKHNLIIRK